MSVATQPPHVAMLGTEVLPIPPVLGGAVEQAVYEASRFLREVRVSVISRSSKALQGSGPETSEIHYVDLKAQERVVRSALRSGFPLWDRMQADRFYFLNGAADVLGRLSPDVIEVHNRPHFFPFLQKQFPGKKFVLSMHNDLFAYGLPEGPLVRSLEKLDMLVVASEFLKRVVLERFPGLVSRVLVEPYGLDTEAWTPALKEKEQTLQIRRRYRLRPGRTLLFVGRVLPCKGLIPLVKAFEIARQKVDGLKLLVVGCPGFGKSSESPYMDQVKRLAAPLGCAVNFTGFVPPCEIPSYFAAADLTVVPSLWDEPFGRVTLESLAVAVPVLASRRGGIPEAVQNGENGLLLEDPEAVETLAEKLVWMILHPEERQRMGEFGRKTVLQNFSMERRVRSLTQLYFHLTYPNGQQKPNPVDL